MFLQSHLNNRKPSGESIIIDSKVLKFILIHDEVVFGLTGQCRTSSKARKNRKNKLSHEQPFKNPPYLSQKPAVVPQQTSHDDCLPYLSLGFSWDPANPPSLAVFFTNPDPVLSSRTTLVLARLGEKCISFDVGIFCRHGAE